MFSIWFLFCLTEDRYPSETVRNDLSAQLNLTDKQLQMWFCHRRLKDRKEKDEDSPSAVAYINVNANVNANSNTNVSRKKPRVEKQNQSQAPVFATSEPVDAAMVSADQYAEEYHYENAERFTPEVQFAWTYSEVTLAVHCFLSHFPWFALHSTAVVSLDA